MYPEYAQNGPKTSSTSPEMCPRFVRNSSEKCLRCEMRLTLREERRIIALKRPRSVLDASEMRLRRTQDLSEVRPRCSMYARETSEMHPDAPQMRSKSAREGPKLRREAPKLRRDASEMRLGHMLVTLACEGQGTWLFTATTLGRSGWLSSFAKGSNF